MAALTARGVARPSAHGQLTISSATACWIALAGSSRNQITTVASASASTMATNHPEIRSASNTTGARRCAPSSTSRIRRPDAGVFAGRPHLHQEAAPRD